MTESICTSASAASTGALGLGVRARSIEAAGIDRRTKEAGTDVAEKYSKGRDRTADNDEVALELTY